MMPSSSSSPRSFLILLLLTLVHLAVFAHAGYSLQTPTAATRWVVGQSGTITIVSTDKATASTSPTARLLTITLRTANRGIFGGTTLVATIRDRVQLLVPAGSTEPSVSLTISDWVVPANVPAETNYIVQVARDKDGFFDIPDKVTSPQFQIVAAVTPPVPGGNTTTTVPLPTITTISTITTITTTTALPTPTLPAGQTCEDVKQQCAAQGKAYVEATGTALCQCGVTLIVPNVQGSGGASIKAQVKRTFQTTSSGPTASLAVLLLVVMALF
ncbi:MAG: hypothetical protein BYD32DRAFT_418646 [Podila humilis]|nr:MAG: hypothetical protein BYD32DRAFT_418646 [Podila humilis]